MLRILNLLVIDQGIPRMVDSFPIVDEELSYEIIQMAEDMLCEYIFGPKYNGTITDHEVFNVINHAYSTGVRKPNGQVYHLVWSKIPE